MLNRFVLLDCRTTSRSEINVSFIVLGLINLPCLSQTCALHSVGHVLPLIHAGICSLLNPK